MNTFIGTVVPGFETIAKKEVKKKIIDATNISISRGKVLFSSNAKINDLMVLDCVDNIYYFIS